MAEILNLVQGSPEWIAARLECFTASEAPAMRGESKYMTRDELLRIKKTGITPEVSSFQQKLFDGGHKTEANARMLLEQDMGFDFYPIVLREGRYMASMDGVDELGTVGFEHKLWNEELAAAVDAGEIPAAYWVQMEQQIALSAVEKIIFMVSDGTREKRVTHDYFPVPGRWEEIQAGWDQFERDLAVYVVPVEAVPVVAKTLEALPALNIVVSGKVEQSNLALFKSSALDFISQINTDLKTDQDFADAENAVKFCTDSEKRIELVKEQALAQTQSIDELFRTLDTLKKELSAKRLLLEKAVKTRKESIKTELKDEALADYRKHTEELQEGIDYAPFAKIRFVVPAIDLDGAMKNKRTISSLRSSVNDAVAKAKVAANVERDRIASNLTIMKVACEGFYELFADAPNLAQKDGEAIEAIVKGRIADHVARQAAAKAAEEQAKAEAECMAGEAIAKAQSAPEAAKAETSMNTVSHHVSGGPTIGQAPASVRATVATAVKANGKPKRAEIVTVIAYAFHVSEQVADGWLKDLTNPF